jgi:predicted RNase H-like nuclease (RuvC/YqgF family)
VPRDKEGKPYSVRYDAVKAMLLNEFLKEHRTVEELKKEIATLTATVKEQASQIQRVTSQLATGRVRGTDGLGVEKPSPQIVLNNQ